MQMYDRMQQPLPVVTFAARGAADNLSRLVYDGEKFRRIISIHSIPYI